MRPITRYMQVDRLMSLFMTETSSEDDSQHLAASPSVTSKPSQSFSPSPLTPWDMVQPPEAEAAVETPAIETPAIAIPTIETPTIETPVVEAEVQSPPELKPPIVSPDALMVAATDLDQPETESSEELPELDPSPVTVSVRPLARPEPVGGGLLTIPLMCLGIGLIACCVLIPAADENHRLVYERERLKRDLDQISHQTDVNDEFLKRIADDPSLSERLAQRQMKMVRQGTSVLELKDQGSDKQMSPFGLLTLAPPADLPPYQPIGGAISSICRNPHGQLYMTGAGLLLIAAGLVLGQNSLAPETSAGDA